MKTIILSIALFSITFCLAQKKKSNTEAIYIKPKGVPTPSLPFSEAVIHNKIIYLSGQVGTLGLKLVEGGIVPETRQAIINIKNLLEQNGSSLNNIIKCTCMLADMNESSDFNKEYIKFFPNNKPARSIFGTTGLALDARIEIECIASLKK